VGHIEQPHGRITIETRRESFIIHPNYGYDESGNEHSDELGAFGRLWRESGHPEFLYDDLRDLIKALAAVAKDRSL
jgi:hypothetical protein